MTKSYPLQRFIKAQEPVYNNALEEITRGRKQTHWMWFIFPQIAGLGKSETSRAYAIQSLAEAKAYLQHPILGNRLRECTRRLLLHDGKSAQSIFGYPDCLKFHSCMTLFSRADEAESLFSEALEIYFDGRRDDATIALLDEYSDI